ncbi:zf-CCHC domain-containing protein [Tanacetum coccineum]
MSHTPVRIEAPSELSKSVENSDLNAQLQEKVFAIISLKNELRKLKGKNVVNTVVSKPNATPAPGMFKLDIKLISPKLKNNRDAHEVYIEKTIEYTDTLRGFVEHDKTQYPSEPLLESACMFTKHVQEMLVYASQTYPNSPKPSEKLVAVTPINKDKRVRFVEPGGWGCGMIDSDRMVKVCERDINPMVNYLKALGEGYSSRNYIRNLKVYEMIIKKDSNIVKAKVERKSIALKDKKESSDEECSTSGSEDEEYAMANGKSVRKCFRCGDPNHLIRECPKPPKDKNQRAFVGGSWSDNGEEDDKKVKNETCLVAHASSEVCFESSYFSDENSSIDDFALDNEYDKL